MTEFHAWLAFFIFTFTTGCIGLFIAYYLVKKERRMKSNNR